MKISINNACNSKCPYCFAGSMGIEKGSEIDPENFKKILDWMVVNDDKLLCVLGGEPTLNPKFGDYLDLICQYTTTFGWKFLLLTNGVLLEKYLNKLPDGTLLLINVNSEKTLGKFQYELMKKSLSELRRRVGPFPEGIVLGCNLHAEEDNYDFFWEIVDKVEPNTVRVSVASPQNNDYLYDRDSYFKVMKKRFMDFIDESIKRKKNVNLDCSLIPLCYFDAKELYKISLVAPDKLNKLCGCDGATFQVIPDMSVCCCFGDDDFEHSKIPMDFDKSYDYYYNYFEEIRDKRVPTTYIEKCRDCDFRKNKMCYAGCFGFKDGISMEDK